MMKRVLLTMALSMLLGASAEAATLSKTYSYFTIRGSTLDQIEKELSRNGPEVKSTGHRHPGATQMEFSTRLAYAENSGRCTIVKADVTVRAKVILPQWHGTRFSDRAVRLVWDTLSADIKRHEESHVIIAKNHARQLEQALLAIGQQPNCVEAASRAKLVSARVLAAHDKAQEDFDRVEGLNFESRILRLLHYRLERIGDGRLKG